MEYMPGQKMFSKGSADIAIASSSSRKYMTDPNRHVEKTMNDGSIRWRNKKRTPAFTGALSNPFEGKSVLFVLNPFPEAEGAHGTAADQQRGKRAR